MNRSTRSLFPGLTFFRILLLAAALDNLVVAIWAIFRPGAIFAFLGVEPRDAMVWQALGSLNLAQAILLMLIVWSPEINAGLIFVPIVGRFLGAALWSWCLGAMQTFPPVRVPFPDQTPLVLLLTHEAIWLPVFGGFLLAYFAWHRRIMRQAGGE